MILWQPSAEIETLRQRASILQKIRNFFNQRGYFEVETPIMAQFGVSDLYLNNIKARFRRQDYSLQTSPEYHMKRLLAAGSGPIFQISKAFRDDELGRWHNPEFSMLEWYQLNLDHHGLIVEVEALLQEVLACPKLIKKTYAQVFLESIGINPHQASIEELKACLKDFALDYILDPGEEDRDQYLFLLMSHVVEPFYATSQAPIAVHAYPPSQASLALLDEEGFASRFEIYYQGLELANGFYELRDASLQRARFEHDSQLREEQGLTPSPPDSFLLAALEHGLPPCSGVALGLDRLIALALKKEGLNEVLSFDFSRA